MHTIDFDIFIEKVRKIDLYNIKLLLLVESLRNYGGKISIKYPKLLRIRNLITYYRVVGSNCPLSKFYLTL